MLHTPSNISAFAQIVLAFHKCIFDFMLPRLPEKYFFSLGYHDKPSFVLIFILEIFEAHGCKQKVVSCKGIFFPWPQILVNFFVYIFQADML